MLFFIQEITQEVPALAGSDCRFTVLEYGKARVVLLLLLLLAGLPCPRPNFETDVCLPIRVPTVE